MSQSDYPDGGKSVAPTLFALAGVAMNLAFVVAGASFAYLLYGLFFGLNDFGTWEAGRQRQMVGNLNLAGNGLFLGLVVAALCCALVYWFEEMAGYLLLIGAAALGIGIPLVFPQLGGSTEPNRGIHLTLSVFPRAALVPGVIGALLVVRDVVAKLASALQKRSLDAGQMEFGKGAQKEDRPVRTSILGKCWEGPYCREFVRIHCPIYIKRTACWRERRGCYCEEDIVSAAATKGRGVALEMAPDSRFNFANPATSGGTGARKAVLSPQQKAERCRNCIIYNEHQREKYGVLLPVTIVVTVALCAFLGILVRPHIGAAMDGLENAFNRFAFTGDPSKVVKLTRPNETAQWAVVVALSVMIVSKSLQVLEWLVFEKKV